MEKDFCKLEMVVRLRSMPSLNWWLLVMTNWQWWWRSKWVHGAVRTKASVVEKRKGYDVYFLLFFSSDHVTKNTSKPNSHLGNTMDYYCWTTNRRIIVGIRIIVVVFVTTVMIIIICSLTKGTIEYWSRCSLCTPIECQGKERRQEKCYQWLNLSTSMSISAKQQSIFTHQKWYPLHARVVVGKKAWNAVVHWYRARYKRVL